MAWHWYALRAIQTMEDRIVALILRQPGFHRAVGRVHKSIHERKHGRDPHEPLAQGEATREQGVGKRGDGFWRHFREEIGRQVRGQEGEWPGKK